MILMALFQRTKNKAMEILHHRINQIFKKKSKKTPLRKRSKMLPSHQEIFRIISKSLPLTPKKITKVKVRLLNLLSSHLKSCLFRISPKHILLMGVIIQAMNLLVARYLQNKTLLCEKFLSLKGGQSYSRVFHK